MECVLFLNLSRDNVVETGNTWSKKKVSLNIFLISQSFCDNENVFHDIFGTRCRSISVSKIDEIILGF